MSRKLGKDKLEKFKQLFIDRKKEIIRSLELNSEIELDIDGDDVDLIQGNILNDITTRLSRRDTLQIARLDAAIKKIDNGTFGECSACDAQIPEKRLFAIPGCELCILCADEEEREARLYAR